MAKKKKNEVVATIGLDGKIVKTNDKQNKNVVAEVDYEGNILPYAPAPSVNNNRNSSFVSSLMNTQNDVFSKVMTFQNQQPSILEEDNSLEGYKDTGKKYGDYYYENYGLFKDTPIYVKNNKYYVNTNGSYQELGNLDKNGNVITGNVMTSKEAEKQKLEDAKKLGYKDNSFKVTSQEYDDIQSSFKKLKKEYKLSDKELQDFIDNGNLTTKHIRIQDKNSDKIRREAIESREKLASGKVKQYSDKGLKISDRIYMDTHDMSDDEKTKYINYITGKRQPEDENKSSFFKTSDVWKDGYDFGDVTKTIVGTGLNPIYSTTKGISNFIEGTSDTISNVLGTGLEKVGSVGNKRKDVTETKNGREYTGYKYGNKNYWYDKKSDRMYDENWNELESFNLDTFQKRYTNTNKIAEFGRQMKEQTANDDTSEVMEVVGKPIKKASVFGDKSNAMFESLGQALPLMAAGNSAGGLLGEKAAVASTSALTFANTYGSAKTTAIRNGASESDAVKSAFIQAAAETISEQFFDSIPGAKSAGWGEKAVGKISSGVEKYFGTQTGKVVAKALDISGEGLEEIISNMITAGGNDIFHAFDKNFTYGMKGQSGNIVKDMANAMISQDSADSFACAIITSAILNGGSAKLNNAQMNNIVSTYAKENNISVNEARIKLDLDSNIEGEEKYSYSNKIPTVIKYEQTDNAKINNFRQSAVNEKMINSKKTQDFMNLVENVISDKDYNIIFDSTITNGKGTVVDGKISLNNSGEAEIRLNPQSDRAAEFLLTHEITHAIETKELRGLILDYANKNPQFKAALKDLQKTYGTTNVNDEVVADISGQILGNQEFINSLSAQNTPQSRNIIKNIYESIKRVLNNFTSKGRYRNFVQDLETKWRDAYRVATNETTKNNLQKIEKYSKVYNNDGTVNRIRINDNVFEGSKDKSISKTIKDYLTKHIGEVYTIIESGQKVYLGKDLPNEYAHSEYTKKLPLNKKLAKGRAVTNLNEIIESATNRTWESNKKEKHKFDAKYGFYKYNTTFSFDYSGSEKIYDGTILIRNDANGKKYLYDILDVKPKKKLVSLPLVASNSNKSSAINSGSSNQSANNIPQSNKNVKSDISTKYSMQSKENNTQELDNSSFSYRGSHQIENAKSITDLDLKDIENKIIDIDGYLTKQSESDLNKLKKILKSTDDKVKIYRASPVNELNSGDWVTTDKSYAKNVANENGGKVYEYEVDPKQLYYPDNIKDLPSLHKLSSFQYVETSTNETSTTDSQGRTLSKEQQEYFKDSKVRDENGDLIPLYHGTTKEFNIFDRDRAGSNGVWYGAGFYFTPSKENAANYAGGKGNVKEIYLNITNPYIPTTDSINKDGSVNFAPSFYDDFENRFKDDISLIIDWDTINKEQKGRAVRNILQDNGYDGIINGDTYVAFEPNQIKNIDNTNPTTNDDIRYSRKALTWQEHLEKNYKATGTRTYFDEMTNTTKKAIAPISNEVKKISNEIKELKKEISERKIPIAKEYQKNTIDEKIESDDNYLKVDSVRDLDPIQISNIKESDASTTPKLPNVRRNGPFANKESSFYKNSTKKSEFLTENSRDIISKEDDVRFYKGITNDDTLEEAYNKLQRGGKSETMKWFSKESKDATAVDVAQGWILLKHYQDSGDYDSMVEVAKKMREIGTTSGQTVQAFNILARLTPEGMVKYAQSELTEAYNKMVENKTKNWIDKHQQDFDLTSEEVQFIIDTMKDVQNMEDGYDKRVKLAEIQKLMTDKLPTERGRKIKSWMRISMLFNPKTQVRNVMGNAIIAPINYFGDIFASAADKMIAKKTGIRTTGIANVKSILKGLKEGAYQATNDYKKGINTRDMEGNRFEIGEGKSFSDKNLIGKNLNRVDGLLNYVMDIGDRVFSQSSFENSLQNQMKLNNTTKITQDMIDIARSESLQRTWNDNNNYTKFVLGVRRGLNKIGIKGYGLGDVLIPFAKTPANLTKAIVDYSPIGLMQSIGNGINLKRSLTNGQYNSKIQHQFVQNLGKATAGTMLYVIGYALAKAKITTGESDDDKDVASFMKNTLGTNSYSIKIGNKSFTYDWAQPLAAPLSITANIVNKKYKSKDLKEFTETVIDSLDTGGSILLEQSFLQSINDVLKNNDGVVSGLVNEVLELPARAIPTFSKQIADMTDSTQRQTYVKGEPVETALNSAKAKIPFVSKTLTPSVDTMGRNIKKYGGKNNAFNVLFNPANVNNENISSAAKEIYKVYNATDDKTIFPRVAPYSIDKLPLSTKQRADYQKIGGELVEKSINELIKNDDYKDLSNKDKAVVISKIVGYNSAKAKSKVLKTKMSRYWNSVNRYLDKGGTVAEYYLYKVVDD